MTRQGVRGLLLVGMLLAPALGSADSPLDCPSDLDRAVTTAYFEAARHAMAQGASQEEAFTMAAQEVERRYGISYAPQFSATGEELPSPLANAIYRVLGRPPIPRQGPNCP